MDYIKYKDLFIKKRDYILNTNTIDYIYISEVVDFEDGKPIIVDYKYFDIKSFQTITSSENSHSGMPVDSEIYGVIPLKYKIEDCRRDFPELFI